MINHAGQWTPKQKEHEKNDIKLHHNQIAQKQPKKKKKHYVHDKFLIGKKIKRRQWSHNFYSIKRKKNCQLRILYPAKTYFKNEGEKVLHIQKLK